MILSVFGYSCLLTPVCIRGGADGAGEWRSREGGGRESVYALQHSQDTSGQVKAHTMLNLAIIFMIYIFHYVISPQSQKKQIQN